MSFYSGPRARAVGLLVAGGSGLSLGAALLLRWGGTEIVVALLGAALAIVAMVFWILDGGSAAMVKRAEVALRQLDAELKPPNQKGGARHRVGLTSPICGPFPGLTVHPLTIMRLFASLAVLFFSAALLHAEDSKPLLNQPGKVMLQPDWNSAPSGAWSVGKGKWEAANGILTGAEIPEEKHAAVLHFATGPANLIVECEFRFDGGKGFLVGCDGNKHIGRVVINAKSIKILDDSTEVKGKNPGRTLAEAALDLKPGEWQRLRVESAGDQMAARLNDVELRAQDPNLAAPKVRWWFALSGATVQVRNVRVSEGEPLAAK